MCAIFGFVLWIIFFPLKMFWRTHTHVLFWGHWYPYLGLLVMTVPSKFKSHGVLYLHCVGKHDVHSQRSTCGATPADLFDSLLATSTNSYIPLPAEMRLPGLETTQLDSWQANALPTEPFHASSHESCFSGDLGINLVPILLKIIRTL